MVRKSNVSNALRASSGALALFLSAALLSLGAAPASAGVSPIGRFNSSVVRERNEQKVAGTLPPEGIYNDKCLPLWDLSQCEAQDFQSANVGITLAIGFNSLTSSPSQFQQLLAYDATIGVKQYIAIANANQDGLNGTNLIQFATGDGGTWPSQCTNGTGSGGAAVTNGQFIQCISNAVGKYPAFGGWYLFDEPGCPYQIGYCANGYQPQYYPNLQAVAAYVHGIDPTHQIIGANNGGAFVRGSCTGACVVQEMQVRNGWIMNASTPFNGGDYYPIGCPSLGCSQPQKIRDILDDTHAMVYAARTGDPMHNIPAYPAEKFDWVGQAFSWAEEGSCSPSACSFPTAAEMQDMRDSALFAAWNEGNPLWAFFWYSYSDVACDHNPVSGCNPSARWQALAQAVAAPFPLKAPNLKNP